MEEIILKPAKQQIDIQFEKESFPEMLSFPRALLFIPNPCLGHYNNETVECHICNVIFIYNMNSNVCLTIESIFPIIWLNGQETTHTA